MRISDWSSDVCSSDLNRNRVRDEAAGLNEGRCGRKAAPPFLTLFLFFRHLRGLYLLVKPGLAVPRREGLTVLLSPAGRQFGPAMWAGHDQRCFFSTVAIKLRPDRGIVIDRLIEDGEDFMHGCLGTYRKRVVEGKCVSVRVDIGGRR